MESIVLILIVFIVVVSYLGFKNISYFEKYLFSIDGILVHKENYRLFSSGFLHGNWFHLGFNIVALSSFGAFYMEISNIPYFFIVYFISLLGGNLLALWLHKNDGNYRAVGASGAISGVMFACILMEPNGEISFLMMEDIGIRSWIFGLAYVVLSIVGIKYQVGNIGHDAHLGGAITGLIVAVALHPTSFIANYWVFLLLFIPTLGFLLLTLYRPELLLIDGWNFKRKKKSIKINRTSKRHIKVVSNKLRDNKIAVSNQDKLDEILDKINSKGYKNLSESEKAFLVKYSKE